MNILFIINDAPYGTEKACNTLRTAMALQKKHAGVFDIESEDLTACCPYHYGIVAEKPYAP